MRLFWWQSFSIEILLGLLDFVWKEKKKYLSEFVPNKSLDYFLFDPSIQGQLTWTTRYKIITEIARGLLYLHQDSRLKIIHRDLKASNILLNANKNPTVADFGMARIMAMDQTQADTSRIARTYGYMAPEYAMHGHFSIKSDVYSFGVIIHEIISGKRNSSFCQPDGNVSSLAAYAWELWRNGSPLEILDPTIEKSYQQTKLLERSYRTSGNEYSHFDAHQQHNHSTVREGEPGFVFKSGNDPDSSFICSVVDASITHLAPR